MEKKLLKLKRLRAFFLFGVLLFASFSVNAQTITGKVTDENGDALVGANIVAKGTLIGTITDMDGEYSIEVPENATALIFSMIGYTKQEVEIAGQSVINLKMELDEEALGEVVIVGYGQVKKNDLTGSVSTMMAKDLERLPATNVGEAMQGLAAGVQVTSNDGTPGGSPSIRIRGVGSFKNGDPLYVVDGFPLSGGIGYLNTNDVESISVLKDASAIAIYGSRAANGVVIIKTKQGAKDKMVVEYSGYCGYQLKPKFYDVLDGRRFAEVATAIGDAESVAYPAEWGTPSSLNPIDWQEEIFEGAWKQSHNVTVRGGNEKARIKLNLGLYDQNGIIVQSFYKRYNASLNADYAVNKVLKIGGNVKLAYFKNQSKLGYDYFGTAGIPNNIPVMVGNPLTNQVKEEINGKTVYGHYTNNDSEIESLNYMALMDDQDIKSDGFNILSNAYLALEPIEGLSLKTNFGVDLTSSKYYNFTKSNDRGRNATENATYLQNGNQFIDWVWENTVTYQKEFGIHGINLLGGISAQQKTYTELQTNSIGFFSENIRSGAEGTIENQINTGKEYKTALASYFGRFTYSLAEKYILTATVRRDGSSRFDSDYQYGTFPSLALAWNAGKESFLSSVDAIDELKIRGSWGQMGNQEVEPFMYLNTYVSRASSNDDYGYPFGGIVQTGVTPYYRARRDLKWETTTQSNFGFDLSFLKKFSVTADYYTRKSEDFLFVISLPAQTGFVEGAENVGSIENKGFEFTGSYRDYRGDFRWSIEANVTTINNEVTGLSEKVPAVLNQTDLNFIDWSASNDWTVFSRSVVGSTVGEFYGYKADGIFQNQAEIDALNTIAANNADNGKDYYQTSATQPGDRKFVDVNGDGAITPDDRVSIGSPIPDWYGSLNINLSYKAFDLFLGFYGVFGNEILNYQKKNLESINVLGRNNAFSNIGIDFADNAWTGEGSTNEYTRITLSDEVVGNNRLSDHFVEDGSFVRLKNIQLGYNLPENVLSKVGLSSARIYVSAQNMLTFTKYSGWDPEIGDAQPANGDEASPTASGIDIGAYPVARTITFGVNLKF